MVLGRLAHGTLRYTHCTMLIVKNNLQGALSL